MACQNSKSGAGPLTLSFPSANIHIYLQITIKTMKKVIIFFKNWLFNVRKKQAIKKATVVVWCRKKYKNNVVVSQIFCAFIDDVQTAT